MCQGVSDTPGQMWHWGCAQPLQGFSSLLDSILPSLPAEIGIGSSEQEPVSFHSWSPQDAIESLCSWKPGVSKVTPAGRIRTTDLPDGVKLAARHKASCNICEQRQANGPSLFSLALGSTACLALPHCLPPQTGVGQDSLQPSGKAGLPSRPDSWESCPGKRPR